jgi:hypothetical protein
VFGALAVLAAVVVAFIAVAVVVFLFDWAAILDIGGIVGAAVAVVVGAALFVAVAVVVVVKGAVVVVVVLGLAVGGVDSSNTTSV